MLNVFFLQFVWFYVVFYDSSGDRITDKLSISTSVCYGTPLAWHCVVCSQHSWKKVILPQGSGFPNVRKRTWIQDPTFFRLCHHPLTKTHLNWNKPALGVVIFKIPDFFIISFQHFSLKKNCWQGSC